MRRRDWMEPVSYTHLTSSSVKVSVEALKLLIEADRKAGR